MLFSNGAFLPYGAHPPYGALLPYGALNFDRALVPDYAVFRTEKLLRSQPTEPPPASIGTRIVIGGVALRVLTNDRGSNPEASLE